MKYIEQFDLKDSISRTYFLLLCLLPTAIIGILIFFLFASFLGTQADEIARLVRDLEIQCEFDAGLREVGITGISCADYIPRIAMFFIFTISWLILATITTVKIFEFVKSSRIRLVVTILSTVSLPALFILKYFSTIGIFSSFLYALTAVCVLFLVLLIFNFKRITRIVQDSYAIQIIFFSSMATFIIISVSFSYFDKNIFSSIGTLNTILLSIIVIYTFLGGLFYYSRATGIPWVTGFLVWIVALNVTGANDRLPVELRAVENQTQVTGDEQFVKWLEARRDLDVYTASNRDYPVYIIAAAGGGTYASIRTAYMLTYLQEICPAFNHHVFAISSVSGGALGALAFASQNATASGGPLGPCIDLNTRELTASGDDSKAGASDPSALDRFFAQDLLSTVVGAGLFPDMLQRALPFPIRKLDRSVAYSDALGQYWRDALDPNSALNTRLAEAASPGCPPEEFFGNCEMANYWDPAGDVPIMIFNSTYVDTGTPIVLSNLSDRFYQGTLAAVNSRDFTDKSIYLIDGASLSARFPVSLPAGFLQQNLDTDSWFRLVDGGYFDTSGLITAEAVKKHIEKIASERGLRVNVRLIFLGEWLERAPEAMEMPAIQPTTTAKIFAQMSASAQGHSGDSPGGSELDAHALALFKARDQRSSFVVTRFLNTIDGTLALRWDPAAIGGISPHCVNVPLAWYLAPCTQQLARLRLDDALFAAEPELSKLRADLSR